MPISPPSRLRAGVIAALAVAAFGASASSALAYQRLDINDTTVQEGSHGVGGTATFTITDHFDKDFDVDEWHGTIAFIRDDDGRVFKTYFINNRGDEAFVSTWNLLDMTALGRQEEWEDSPDGYPQSPPYEWWDWHDEYGTKEPSRWFGEPDPNDPNDQRPPRKDA